MDARLQDLRFTCRSLRKAPGDPAVLAGTAALLLAAAAIAGVVPVRRALAAGPAAALREE